MELVFFLIFLGTILISIVTDAIANGIGATPTGRKAKQKILNAAIAPIEGAIYDLGSGWGGMAFALAKKFGRHQVRGYENAFFPYLFSRLKACIVPTTHVQLYRSNFFQADLSDAAIIYCYLYPAAMLSLRNKLKKGFHPECIVISNTFAIPGWKPFITLNSEDIYQSKIYFYRCGDQEKF